MAVNSPIGARRARVPPALAAEVLPPHVVLGYPHLVVDRPVPPLPRRCLVLDREYVLDVAAESAVAAATGRALLREAGRAVRLDALFLYSTHIRA